jgi:CubicO group peptidase (beta-lactamase class C family)
MARLAAILLFFAILQEFSQDALPKTAAIDARVQKLMSDTVSKGLALAVIDEGKIVYVQASHNRPRVSHHWDEKFPVANRSRGVLRRLLVLTRCPQAPYRS